MTWPAFLQTRCDTKATTSGMGQARPFAVVEPHASFTSPANIHRDNQAVALGRMLSRLDRFRFFGNGRGIVGGGARRDTELLDTHARRVNGRRHSRRSHLEFASRAASSLSSRRQRFSAFSAGQVKYQIVPEG
jgi:hypothetical protein